MVPFDSVVVVVALAAGACAATFVVPAVVVVLDIGVAEAAVRGDWPWHRD